METTAVGALEVVTRGHESAAADAGAVRAGSCRATGHDRVLERARHDRQRPSVVEVGATSDAAAPARGVVDARCIPGERVAGEGLIDACAVVIDGAATVAAVSADAADGEGVADEVAIRHYEVV